MLGLPGKHQEGNYMSIPTFALKATAVAVTMAGAGAMVFKPLPDTTALDRAPVAFVEQGTNNCVAAFRRGTQSDPDGVTGVHCLDVVVERHNHQVIEKFVPRGTTFIEVMEQFGPADPWQDEFIDLDSE